MKQIPLTQGKAALVDDEDYERVSQFKWYAELIHKNWRARRIVGKGRFGRKCIYMHRFILNAPEGVHVDHKNGDGLDNRRCNLRLATPSQNMWNRKGRLASNSGYKGITPAKTPKNKWRAQIKVPGLTVKHLGQFVTREEAARAYDEAARKYYGEFACVNFPRNEHESLARRETNND